MRRFFGPAARPEVQASQAAAAGCLVLPYLLYIPPVASLFLFLEQGGGSGDGGSMLNRLLDWILALNKANDALMCSFPSGHGPAARFFKKLPKSRHVSRQGIEMDWMMQHACNTRVP